MSQYYRRLFFSNLVKEAALKSEDIKVLQDIFVSKYQGHTAAKGLARQYYDKFIKKSYPEVTLIEDTLPQPLPPTIDEMKILLRSVDTVKNKSRSEELSEELKSKHPDIDLSNLNEDYLSWLHRKYIKGEKKSNEIVHSIEEAIVTLRKFPAIQDKFKSIPEFRKKVEDAGYLSISSIKDLTIDDMERIISLDDTGLTVRVHDVEIKDEEFLGKFGEWNLWLPHTKETSVKIAGYDEDYNPKTTWCTGRTKGSNLFYNYIGRSDYPVFLFYIIKDNPINANDWLSLGYVSSGGRLVPDFSGRGGGLSVDRDNRGLRESDYSSILGEQWPLIRSRIESEIERHKVEEEGREIYISPARSIIERLAKDAEGLKKELKPKSNEEKKDFINLILNSNPSDEVKDISAKEYLRIDPYEFLSNFSRAEWAKPYIPIAAPKVAELRPYEFLYHFSIQEWAKPYIPIAAPKMAELESYNFLTKFSEQEWAKPYIPIAAPKMAESNPYEFLRYFSEEEWAKPYIPIAAPKTAESNPFDFLKDFSEKEWAKPHIPIAVPKAAESYPYLFLRDFSEKEWASPYIPTAASRYAESNPYEFLRYFSEKEWVKPYIPIVAPKVAKLYPREFLYHFSEAEWAKPHIPTAAPKAAELKPYEFIDSFSGEEWAKPHIPTAAPKAAELLPYLFLTKFSEEEWAKHYIHIAAPKAAESEPYDFLKDFSKAEWAEPYIDTAAPKAAESKPYLFLTKFSEKEWAEPYIPIAAPKVAKSDPYDFLINFSNKEWAKPYIDTAAPKAAKSHPYEFLTNFSEQEWAKPHIDTAATKAAESNHYSFLEHFSEKEWAKPYIDTAAPNAAELKPYNFMIEFSKKEWANTKTITPAGKMTWIEYVKKIANNLSKSSSKIDNIGFKLLKLSNVLFRLNLKKEALLIKKLY